ncbi:MAG: hypothetical protein LBJ38_01525 [Oscillospiraceae bacterium]|jgi:hypothetical protein|nr:hypothetical protein [Oscillospiraceae bacterium]
MIHVNWKRCVVFVLLVVWFPHMCGAGDRPPKGLAKKLQKKYDQMAKGTQSSAQVPDAKDLEEWNEGLAEQVNLSRDEHNRRVDAANKAIIAENAEIDRKNAETARLNKLRALLYLKVKAGCLAQGKPVPPPVELTPEQPLGEISPQLDNLKRLSFLTQFCEQRAKEMYEHNYFDHVTADGKPWNTVLFSWVDKNGLPRPTAWAENIQKGTGPELPTPAVANARFAQSAGHYRNMIGLYNRIGTGSYVVKVDGLLVWHVVEMFFYW